MINSYVDLSQFSELGSNPGGVVSTMFTIVGVVVIVYSLVYLIGGIGVLRSRDWGRVIGIVVGILSGLFWLAAVGGSGSAASGNAQSSIAFPLVLLLIHAYIGRGADRLLAGAPERLGALRRLPGRALRLPRAVGEGVLGPRVVVGVERFLRAACHLGHVGEIHPDPVPERGAAAHAVDQHVRLLERGGLGVARLPTFEASSASAFVLAREISMTGTFERRRPVGVGFVGRGAGRLRGRAPLGSAAKRRSMAARFFSRSASASGVS